MARPKSDYWIGACSVVTFAKLWLMRGQPIFAISPAAVDDRLFVALASNIRNGLWLGPYNDLTLAKGPFYPIWIAAVNLCHLPLRLSEQVLYAMASFAIVAALFPLTKSLLARSLTYLLLLLNPMSFETAVLGRVVRQNLYTPLTMLIFAGLIALILRAGSNVKARVFWVVGLGISFGAFWLTREEGLWIVPAVLLLIASAVFVSWKAKELKLLAILLSLSASCALLPILIVCLLNAHYYGWFGTVEFKAREFKDAYGSLLRVTSPIDIASVPVTSEARALIYRVSPTFSKVKPFLEGETGRPWAAGSVPMTHRDAKDMEIAGAWFMWALRDSVAAAGFCDSAKSSLQFYGQLADEVNTACDDGRLPAGPRRSGMIPPWRPEQTGQFCTTFLDFSEYFIAFRGFTAQPPPSMGPPVLLDLFRDMTLDRLMPSPEAPGYEWAREEPSDRWKIAVLRWFGKVERKVLYVWVIAGLVFTAGSLVVALVKRRVSIELQLAIACLVACIVTVAVNALVDVTSFPNKSVGALAQGYPLLLLFLVLATCEALRTGRVCLAARSS